jgi:metallopeptidase MepB
MLFHELGHGIHDLVSKTTYARFHGTNTAQDFCETPSQMLENWCWTPSVLKSLSHHYSRLSPDYLASWKEQANRDTEVDQPPRTIPDSMIESLIRTKHVNKALFYLGQLRLAIFDMTVHSASSHREIEEMNISEFWNSLGADILKIAGPQGQGESYEWGHGEVVFPHLMDGYDAGYYGYLR